MSTASAQAPLLQVEHLRTRFAVRGRRHQSVLAVDDVSLSLNRGEVLGLVGESGCGKSTLARSLLRLVEPEAGRVLFGDQDLLQLDAKALRGARRRMQMVFQDPYASLNPRMQVRSILSEPLRLHQICSEADLEGRLARLLDLVGLPRKALLKYPHEFSGGQRQRIAIARALAPEPELLIADEPVSALDVSIQAQIINLFQSLVRELQLGLLFIAHDLSVVKHLSDRVAVMYLGRIVETGPAVPVIERPRHPYTQALVAAIPVPDPARARISAPLQGDPPSPLAPPSGCAFHPRCPYAVDLCRLTRPELVRMDDSRLNACLRQAELAQGLVGGDAGGRAQVE